MKKLLAPILLLAAAPVADAADAPSAPPPPMMKISIVRGTIADVTHTSLTIKTDAGTDLTAAVNGQSKFAAVEKRSFSQLKSTDFVGITAVPGENGHLKAEEIHVLPFAVGEGQYPWDHHPSSAKPSSAMGSMTNGLVSAAHAAPAMASSMTNGSITPGAGNWQLNVTYKGAAMMNGKCEGLAMPGQPGCTGSATVDVTPDTPIVAIVPAKQADVKPGLAAVAFVANDPQGHAVLGSVTIEKNGVKPEM